jgi:hypothetical protein
VNRLALAVAVALACVGPADARTDDPRIVAGATGASVEPSRDVQAAAPSQSLAQLVYPPLTYPTPSYPPLTYPPVTYGSPVAPPAAGATAAQGNARQGPTGSTCRAFLVLAWRIMSCPLPAPRALGAACGCAYPPPPPGILRSRPAVGRVVS